VTTPFIAGVIEGFYGPPWTWRERRELIEALADWGGNWWVWAPKSAPRHRDSWRDPFDADEREGFASLTGAGVAISVGLTPGADATVDDVVAKLSGVEESADGFTLCVDDLDEGDAAERHALLANGVLGAFGRPVWLVPTHYAGSAHSSYLDVLCAELDPSIEAMWTGETVVCDRIEVDHATGRARACGGRAPLLWDNTPVNDAMMRDLLHLGPYAGRSPGLRTDVSGVLVNPMEFAVSSRPTIRSAMAWAHGRDHLAEWRDEVESLGLAVLAEATSFPGDPHWPGDEPDRGWWESVRALDDPADERLTPWVIAAREGARAALAVLDASDRAGGARAAQSTVAAALAWRAWRTSAGPCVLGRGPRVRPIFSQDETTRFVPRPGVATDAVSLVDALARRTFDRAGFTA